MKSYTDYLFDADGTLFDTVDLIYSCFNHVADKHLGHKLDRETLVKKIGMPLVDMLAHFLGRNIDINAVLDDYMQHQLEILADSVVPFPDVITTLDILKEKGKKLAIVTSRRRYSMEVILDVTKTRDYFDVLITPESTRLHKPNPEPALRALSLLDGSKETAVFIGDAFYDICSGSSAGTDTVFVTWSHNSASTLPVTPTWTIDSMLELIAPL